jgi:hypothetical protein
MAKRNPDLDLTWLLFKRDYQGTSRITGGDYWRLHWYCMQTGEYRVTDVDSSMKNFTRSGWDIIVNAESPWGMYKNLKKQATRTTRTWDDPVITADSVPDPQEIVSMDDVYNAVKQLEDIYYPRTTVAQRLFDFA